MYYLIMIICFKFHFDKIPVFLIKYIRIQFVSRRSKHVKLCMFEHTQLDDTHLKLI